MKYLLILTLLGGYPANGTPSATAFTSEARCVLAARGVQVRLESAGFKGRFQIGCVKVTAPYEMMR